MKMYIKRYGMFFNCQCVTLVILIVLITACDACPRRRSPPPSPTRRTTSPTRRTTSPTRRTTSPTKHSQEPTIATKKTSESGSGTSSMPPTTTIKTPTHSGTRQPDQSYHFCYSTTFESLTIDIIKKELSDLGKAGNLTDSFNGSDGERIVFLKWMPPNNTNCSDIVGYIINITRRNNNYTFSIKHLEKEQAIKNCERFQYCPFRLSVPTNKASENTKPTEPSKTTQPEEQNASQETSSEQPPGPTVAERSDDKSGVSSTTIGIPVAVVVVLVIVVTISVCWFKRRSKSKGYKEEKTENSANHMVGPLGDLYTIANPNAEKERNGKDENNDLVYTELSHMKSRNEESVEEQPESDQPDYADITHILKAGETTYENVAFQSEKDTYANVVALQ